MFTLETITHQPLDVAAVHSVTEPPPASAEFPIFIFIIFGMTQEHVYPKFLHDAKNAECTYYLTYHRQLPSSKPGGSSSSVHINKN